MEGLWWCNGDVDAKEDSNPFQVAARTNATQQIDPISVEMANIEVSLSDLEDLNEKKVRD